MENETEGDKNGDGRRKIELAERGKEKKEEHRKREERVG